METPVPCSDKIQNMRIEDGRYVFETNRGLLGIKVVTEQIINVSFTVNKVFAPIQSWITPIDDCIDANISENENVFCISTPKLRVHVSKLNSSVSFSDINGEEIFKEDSSHDRMFEQVPEYRVINDDSVESKDVVTADGVKKVITEANKAQTRTLYRNRLHVKLGDDEALYGLGQAEEGNLNLRNTVRYLHQANRRIAVPVIMSVKGYGLFFPTGSGMVFSDNCEDTFFQTEASEMMEYYFLGGSNMDESIAMLRKLTGKAVMLPRWAFGYLQSKERYESESELLETADEFRQKKIGIDALILDWITWEENMWGQKSLDAKRFPHPLEMTKKLHDKDVKLMISIWPNMTSASENYKEFAKRKLLFPGTEVYDALKPEARKLYWKQVNEGLFKHGFDGWWCDSSEPFTPEWTKAVRPEIAKEYYDFIEEASKVMPYDEINAYGFYHAMGIYEGQRSQSNKRVINLTRNGYLGSQRFGVIVWSGDIGASYKTLANQVAEGLNMCASGLPYWTLDIGAFFVRKGAPWYWEGHYDKALLSNGYKELYVRWYQYGAFLPIFRSHGTDCPREPWRFGKPGDMFYDALIAANELRYKLMPYIYSMAYEVYRNDYTMMRLLAMDFPNDEKVWNIKSQYMFGGSLMVCPVLDAMYYDEHDEPINKEHKSRVYLPKGCDWYDLRNNAKYTGGQYVTVNAGIESIPVFVKSGSILPMCDERIESTAHLELRKVSLYVYGRGSSRCTIYSDSGDGYEYLSGEYCLTDISHENGSNEVIISYEGDERFKTNISETVFVE